MTDLNWQEIFHDITNQHDFTSMKQTINECYKTGEVYPPEEEIYTAFELTPFDSIKAVILGQIHITAKVSRTVWLFQSMKGLNSAVAEKYV